MGDFADNLKRIRNEMGLSQEEFAKLLKTSKQNISRYEARQVSPKISTAAKFADILNVSLSELSGDEERAKEGGSSPNTTTIQIVHPEIRILAKGLDQLPEADRRKAVAMAKTIFDAYSYLFDEKGATNHDP